MMRRTWLPISLSLVLAMGCALLGPDDKDSLPTDHELSIGGALHKRDPFLPFRSPGNCAAYGCHHANLRGGWARVIDKHSGVVRETESPSCYQCHGALWSEDRPEFVQVLHPTSDTVWRHGESRPVEWIGPASDAATLLLYRDFALIDTLVPLGATDGVERLEAVRPAWGTGRAFRVRVVQASGDETFGEAFSICRADDGLLVTRPTAGAVVWHGEPLNVEWSCAAGVAVDIFIRDDRERLDVVRRGAGNGGFFGRTVPASWGTGTSFRIEVVDAEGLAGFSEPFEIRHPGPGPR